MGRVNLSDFDLGRDFGLKSVAFSSAAFISPFWSDPNDVSFSPLRAFASDLMPAIVRCESQIFSIFAASNLGILESLSQIFSYLSASQVFPLASQLSMVDFLVSLVSFFVSLWKISPIWFFLGKLILREFHNLNKYFVCYLKWFLSRINLHAPFGIVVPQSQKLPLRN